MSLLPRGYLSSWLSAPTDTAFLRLATTVGGIATAHLLDLGHRRLGVIAGPSYASSSLGRVEGYRQGTGRGRASRCAWIALFRRLLGSTLERRRSSTSWAWKTARRRIFASERQHRRSALFPVFRDSDYPYRKTFQLSDTMTSLSLAICPTPPDDAARPFEQIAVERFRSAFKRRCFSLTTGSEFQSPTLIPRKSSARAPTLKRKW